MHWTVEYCPEERSGKTIDFPEKKAFETYYDQLDDGNNAQEITWNHNIILEGSEEVAKKTNYWRATPHLCDMKENFEKYNKQQQLGFVSWNVSFYTKCCNREQRNERKCGRRLYEYLTFLKQDAHSRKESVILVMTKLFFREVGLDQDNFNGKRCIPKKCEVRNSCLQVHDSHFCVIWIIFETGVLLKKAAEEVQQNC